MKKRNLKADLEWLKGERKIVTRRALAEETRAIKAEALVRELVEVIDELRRQIDECGLDSEMWEVYRAAKEVLD